MKVLVVGGSGSIGGRLVESLVARDHDVVVSTRKSTRPNGLPENVRTITWDTEHPVPTSERFDAVVNEAGASLIGKRWSESYKRELEESRVTTNRRLAEWIQQHRDPPQVFVTASAVGVYGYAPAGPVDEDAPPGDDFLAQLCLHWEQAAETAHSSATRVVQVRQGIVLDPHHGALGTMLPFFRAGLGGPIGDGKQPFPWIAPDDLTAVLLRAIEDPSFDGPYNAVSPERVTNKEFTRVLGDVLNRPTVLPVPPFALKALYGEGAEPVLTGQDAVPKRLQEAGFAWRQPQLAEALRTLLGRPLTVTH